MVESAQAGGLLPWRDYIFNAGDRAEEIEGTKAAQKSLLNSFVSQPRAGTSSSRPLARAAAVSGGTSSTPRIAESESSNLPKSPTSPPKSPTKPSTTHPLFTTDPTTPEKAAAVPSYAAHKSNPHAAKAMANPEWRAAHTSVASDYIEGYYKNSRLHHLSTWKSELKNLVIEAQERAEAGLAGALGKKVDTAEGGATAKIAAEAPESRPKVSAGDGVSMRGTELVVKSPSKGKGKQKAETEEKVIMHCDFDSFFVSAGLVNRPDMKGKPVVVCHSQGGQGGASSTSEIASASYEARGFGIKNGMRYASFLSLPWAFVL